MLDDKTRAEIREVSITEWHDEICKYCGKPKVASNPMKPEYCNKCIAKGVEN